MLELKSLFIRHIDRLELSSCILETNLPGLEAMAGRTPKVEESEVWVPEVRTEAPPPDSSDSEAKTHL